MNSSMNEPDCDCPEPIELFTCAIRLHAVTCAYCIGKGFGALIVDGIVLPIYVEPIQRVANSQMPVKCFKARLQLFAVSDPTKTIFVPAFSDIVTAYSTMEQSQ